MVEEDSSRGVATERQPCPLTAVHAGRFNLVVNRRDQGWAPQILPQLLWMEGAPPPPPPARGINRGRDGQREGGEGRDVERERGFSCTGQPLMLQGLQGSQAGVIRRKVKHDESCSTL